MNKNTIIGNYMMLLFTIGKIMREENVPDKVKFDASRILWDVNKIVLLPSSHSATTPRYIFITNWGEQEKNTYEVDKNLNLNADYELLKQVRLLTYKNYREEIQMYIDGLLEGAKEEDDGYIDSYLAEYKKSISI